MKRKRVTKRYTKQNKKKLAAQVPQGQGNWARAQYGQPNFLFILFCLFFCDVATLPNDAKTLNS